MLLGPTDFVESSEDMVRATSWPNHNYFPNCTYFSLFNEINPQVYLILVFSME